MFSPAPKEKGSPFLGPIMSALKPLKQGGGGVGLLKERAGGLALLS